MARTPATQETESLPEADRLEGFTHPRHTAQVFGQESAERTLLAAFGSGRMHHAWLITGPEGVGKATLAYRFATYLLAEPQERDPFAMSLGIADECAAARQVRALSHPGLLVIRRPYDLRAKRLRGEITVDEVRRLRDFVGLTADEGAWRVVIVDAAEDLNASSANALLKSLEEPPEHTVFLLVSSAPGRLLSTIRSRCRTLEAGTLAGSALRKAVTQALTQATDDISEGLPSEGDWERLERLSQGSVRRALTLHASGGLALYDRVVGQLSKLPNVDWAGLHRSSDELASPAAEQRFELFYGLLLGLLSRLVHAAATGEGDAKEVALADRLIGPHRLAAFAEVWETVVADKAQALALNLDRRSLILETFSRLEAAARH